MIWRCTRHVNQPVIVARPPAEHVEIRLLRVRLRERKQRPACGLDAAALSGMIRPASVGISRAAAVSQTGPREVETDLRHSRTHHPPKRPSVGLAWSDRATSYKKRGLTADAPDVSPQSESG